MIFIALSAALSLSFFLSISKMKSTKDLFLSSGPLVRVILSVHVCF